MQYAEILQYGGAGGKLEAPMLEFSLNTYTPVRESIDAIIDSKNGVRRVHKGSSGFLLVDAFCQKNYQGGDILDPGEDFKGLKDPDFYLTTNKDENIIGTLGIRESETPPELKDLNTENKGAFELMRFSYDASAGMKAIIKSTQHLFRRAIDFLCLQTESGEAENLFLWMLTYKKMTQSFAAVNRISDLFACTGRVPPLNSMPPKCRCFFKKEKVGFFLVNTKNKELRKMFLESRARQDSLLRDLPEQMLDRVSVSLHSAL